MVMMMVMIMMMMMMMMKKMMIMLMLMLMLMLSRIAFFNTVSKENYEEVHPKQSALATAHHGRQALQHYQFCAGCAALFPLCKEALCRLCSTTKAVQHSSAWDLPSPFLFNTLCGNPDKAH